jgi:hypothetical protein
MKNNFFILLIICFCLNLIAQDNENRFRLILSGGISGTQVDGDTYSGYNKIGTNAGIYINRKTGENTENMFGITYIQKGSRSNSTIQNPNYYLLKLNYLEVPFLFIYNHKSKYRFEVGLSGAYLFSDYEENGMIGAYKGSLKKLDVCYNMGAGYKLNDKTYINLRYSYSLLPIREYNRNVYLGNFWQRIFNRGLYNNCISISINYIISPNSSKNE